MLNKLKKSSVLWLLGGIVMGIGLVYGAQSYIEILNQRKAEAFIQGFQNATDKRAYIDDYFHKSGKSIDLSKAKADGYCSNLFNSANAVLDMVNYYIRTNYVMDGDTHKPGKNFDFDAYSALLYELDTIYYEIDESCRGCEGSEDCSSPLTKI